MTGAGGTLGVVGGALPHGAWAADTSHFPKPVTRITASVLVGRLSAAATERWGLALAGAVDFAVDDDGWVYVRDPPLDDPDEVRRRAPTAAETVRTRRWLDEADRWYTITRPAVVAELFALQDETIQRFDDAALAGHVERVAAAARRLLALHMELHLTDMVPLGALLAVGARRWGLEPFEVVALMDGASPASAPSAELEAARRAVAAVDGEGTDWRRLPEVGAFLRVEGHHLVSEPEAAAAALHERPELVEQLLRAESPTAPASRRPTSAAAVRDRVPAADRPVFDELLADARLTYGLRDDNTRLTAMWPLGLVRRACLEAAGRLGAHLGPRPTEAVFGFEPGELAGALRVPAATAELAGQATARHDRRRRAEERRQVPGDVGEWRPLDRALLSPDQRWLHDALDAYGAHYGSGTDAAPLTGIGVSGEPVTGPAVVAVSPLDALDRIEPGRSVLVVTATAPAYDAVLPLVAGLVVETGGLLCHAALAGRQLGLPVVVGVAGATRLLHDGDEVAVDPPQGSVAVVSR